MERGSHTEHEALQALIADDHDPATLAAATRSAAQRPLIEALLAQTDDPEVLWAISTSRWPGASPPAVRRAAQMALDGREAAAAAEIRRTAQGALQAAQTGDPRALLRQSPEVTGELVRRAIADGDARTLAVVLTSELCPMTAVDDAARRAVASRGAAHDTDRHRLARATAVALSWRVEHGLPIGSTPDTARTAARLVPDRLQPTARAITERSNARTIEARDGALADLRSTLVDESAWIPVGTSASIAAGRERAAWQSMAQLDDAATVELRRRHIQSWGTWGDSRVRAAARLAEAAR